jgi:hypothetical protein
MGVYSISQSEQNNVNTEFVHIHQHNNDILDQNTCFISHNNPFNYCLKYDKTVKFGNFG